MIKLIIFDLDGTLINSLADIAISTNYALEACGFSTHPTEAYKHFVGNGIYKLFERALPANEATPDNLARMHQLFKGHYDTNGLKNTLPYPGIQEVLDYVVSKNYRIAIASNKYHQATVGIVNHYFPHIPFDLVLGQREGVLPKPDPTIIYDILDHTGISKSETLYVGDSDVDMQTAIAGGVLSMGVTWGFRKSKELASYQPTYLIDAPHQLIDLLEKQR